MAKGIRSKSMRKNRSYLRATLSEPIAKKRIEEMHDSLKKNIAEKKSTDSLMNLKKLMPTAAGSANKKVEEEMEEADEEEEEEEEEVQAAPKKSKKVNPFKKEKVVKAARPKKELVWFK